MNNTPSQSQSPPSAESQEMASLMFAQLVMQHSNMALIFLGKTPHPQTGETAQDLEHARYFIDQLEMLAVKTRGNLDPHEDGLLKQTLTGLRLAFVDAVSHPQTQPAAAANTPASAANPEPAPAAEQPAPAPSASPASTESAEAASQAESHKKFTKKY